MTMLGSRSPSARLLLAVSVLPLLGCPLLSIEPDEIDVADDAASSDDEIGSDETSPDDEGTSEGEGNDTELDTDTAGKLDMGDGSTGDGDGDPTTDTSTDDGSETTGADVPTCEMPGIVSVGNNPVEVPDAASQVEGSCGGSLGEAIYEFQASAMGVYAISLTEAEFSAVLYVVDDQCEPVPEQCASEPASLQLELAADQIVRLAVDSDADNGSAVLVIEAL